jgi:hypothetical protein
MGFITRVLKREPALDKDAAAIHALRKVGVDLERPVVLRHYLYFAYDYEAGVAAAELSAEGFSIEINSAPLDSGFLLLARRAETVVDESVRRLRGRLFRLALSFKGEYDGWDVELPSGDAFVAARH